MMTKEKFSKKVWLSIGATAAILITMTIAALSANRFPRPSGPYSVGAMSSELVDTARPEGDRRLLVQFYYPTQEKHHETTPYTPNPRELEEDLNAIYGIPKFLIRRISRAEVPVQVNGQPHLSGERFPLLIFSHGFDDTRFQNSFLLPELVSQGYIIASVEHPGTASGTVFQDGSRGRTEILGRLMVDEPFSLTETEKWSRDQRFVLDQIEDLTLSGQLPFGPAIDFDRIGIFGHSFGGATSAATLTQDNRFRAGINMDGFYFGDFYKIGFEQPFMEIRAENESAEDISDKALKSWDFTREQYRQFLFTDWAHRINSYARNGYESYTIRHSNHMSFSDFTLIMPLPFLTAPHQQEHHQITTQLVQRFFDKHLKGNTTMVPEKLQAYLK